MLTSAASGTRPQMLTNGREIPVDPRTGHGLVTLRVPPARTGQPDTVRARWQGEVRYNSSGRDTSWQLSVPYFIVKRPQP